MPEPTSTSPAKLMIPPDRRVLLCVGPGGVGKTTVAAALGLAAARQGRKVIVVTIDPSRRLAQALGLPTTSHEQHSIVRVPGSEELGAPLDCLLLSTSQVFDTIVRGYSTSAQVATRMLDNPIYQATVRYLGGALEYAAIARVHMLVSEGRYDLVVLDTPPTANAIEFLDAPGRISEVLTNPAAKFLASSSRLGMKFFGLASSMMLKAFEAIGGGPFIGQLGAFLADFGTVLAEFQRRAGDVEKLLVSRNTGVVLTTSANDFSVREAKDFLQVLVERNLRIDGVVLNRVDAIIPPFPGGDPATALAAAQQQGVSEEAAHLYTMMHTQCMRSRKVQLDLERSYPRLPICVLPRRFPPPVGLDELMDMGESLMPKVDA